MRNENEKWQMAKPEILMSNMKMHLKGQYREQQKSHRRERMKDNS